MATPEDPVTGVNDAVNSILRVTWSALFWPVYRLGLPYPPLVQQERSLTIGRVNIPDLVWQ